ncbi:MAG: methyltransferase domain-containing protein [Ruminococcaceae bacterium]|nr:methyltransferase domain-containing protein [Oscillospiraceae bacterium]
MSLFTCPVCGGQLEQQGRSLVCGRKHCYDIARAGYVNLLMNNSSGSKRHGDDAAQIQARTRFLDGGHYRPLLDALCEAAEGCLENDDCLVDAGCGEGYYTAGLLRHMRERGVMLRAAGIDISRDALRQAARRGEDIELAAASVFRMPIADRSADVVLSIFAPTAAEEFRRVLNKGGRLIQAVPLERHLFGLKQAVYDRPQLNPPEPPMPEGFRLLDCHEVRFDLTIEGETITDLFTMTPYVYKTGADDQRKLAQVERLTTEIEVAVRVLGV